MKINSLLAGIGISFCFWMACAEPFSQGENLYMVSCASCHMEDGSGLGGVIPDLRERDIWQFGSEDLPCLIRWGSVIRVTDSLPKYPTVMPPHPSLTEVEIANILNFLQDRWGDPSRFYTPEDILRQLERCSVAMDAR